MKFTTGHVIVVLVVLLVGIAVATNPSLLLSLLGRTQLTVRVTPVSSGYALGQQVTVSGVLTCSGSGCPPNTMYGMPVELSSSWGWTGTATTNDAGAYSTSVTLPSTSGVYTISAFFDGAGEVSDSHAVISVAVGTSPATTTTPTGQTTTQKTQTTTQKTTTTTRTSTGTTTSEETSTFHTTTTITSGSGTGTETPSLEGAEAWLKSNTNLLGYDVPNWYFIAGFLVVLILLWLRQRSS